MMLSPVLTFKSKHYIWINETLCSLTQACLDHVNLVRVLYFSFPSQHHASQLSVLDLGITYEPLLSVWSYELLPTPQEIHKYTNISFSFSRAKQHCTVCLKQVILSVSMQPCTNCSDQRSYYIMIAKTRLTHELWYENMKISCIISAFLEEQNSIKLGKP